MDKVFLLLFSHQVLFNSFVTSLTVAHQAPLSMEFPRQEYWSGLQFPSPGNLSDPGIKPTSPELAGGCYFFTTEPPGIPKVFLVAGFSLPLNISCHSLLACRISVEKSAPIVLWEVPCMLLAVISLAAFNSFTLIFSGPFSLFSFWGPYNVNINVLHVVPGLFLSLFYSLAVISTTFSSSSLIYSSVSFNLILIHSNVFFI